MDQQDWVRLTYFGLLLAYLLAAWRFSRRRPNRQRILIFSALWLGIAVALGLAHRLFIAP